MNAVSTQERRGEPESMALVDYKLELSLLKGDNELKTDQWQQIQT